MAAANALSSTATRVALVGVACFVGALFGTTQTIAPVAILWPPSAVLLAVFLLLDARRWPAVAVAGLVGQSAAIALAFTPGAAVVLGLINVFEAWLAAWLIRRWCAEPFDFDRLYNGACFLLGGPLLAGIVAALLGASAFVLMGATDTGFLAPWRLWWFSDAVGMLVLVPAIVRIARELERHTRQGLSRLRWLELAALWGTVVALAGAALMGDDPESVNLYFTPMLLLLVGIWAALRFGVLGASLTVALIAVSAIGHLAQEVYPYPEISPRQAVWLTQEYLTTIAVVSVGLAILMHEIAQQREALREQDRALQAQNVLLERRIGERTAELERANRELRRANAYLGQLATTDYLTGFANRRHFEELGQRELQRLGRDGITASVVMFDMDHFKAINDRYGHEVGDEVLRQIRQPVGHSLRPLDLCGRAGGEEFAMLLAEADEARACQIAERIRAGIADMQIAHRAGPIHVTASFGVAEWTGREDLSVLMQRADAALYRAKNAGRNCVRT